jgi:hypothetical protein
MANTVRQSGNVGARFDLRVRKGANLEQHQLQLLQTASGAPFDLTGYLVNAWCKGRGVNAGLIVTFDVTRVSDALGKINLDMGTVKTALLPGPLYSTSPPEVMDWWLQITSPGLVVTPIFYGEFEING